MSGTAEPVRQAKTDAEWARQQQRRTESLENPTSQRIGEWVLSTSTDGNLIASYVEGGSSILARPQSSEDDPDAIADDTPACVTVTKLAAQSVSSSGAVISFDGISVQQGGDWTGGKAAFNSVIVPKSGIYVVTSTVWFSSGNATMSALLMADGVDMLAARINDSSGDAWMSVTVAGQVRLTAGAAVSLFAQATGVTRSIGAATVFTPVVPTMLSLSQIGS